MYYIYCITLCYSLLHYSLLHYIILHCIVLHCIILHCIFLYKKKLYVYLLIYIFVDNRYIIDAYNDSIHFSLRAVLLCVLLVSLIRQSSGAVIADMVPAPKRWQALVSSCPILSHESRAFYDLFLFIVNSIFL